MQITNIFLWAGMVIWFASVGILFVAELIRSCKIGYALISAIDPHLHGKTRHESISAKVQFFGIVWASGGLVSRLTNDFLFQGQLSIFSLAFLMGFPLLVIVISTIERGKPLEENVSGEKYSPRLLSYSLNYKLSLIIMLSCLAIIQSPATNKEMDGEVLLFLYLGMFYWILGFAGVFYYQLEFPSLSGLAASLWKLLRVLVIILIGVTAVFFLLLHSLVLKDILLTGSGT